MDAETRAGVLKVISDVQQSTSSVTVQVGGRNESSGIVQHDTLYIKNAPARIISELEGMGYRLSVEEEGVRVEG